MSNELPADHTDPATADTWMASASLAIQLVTAVQRLAELSNAYHDEGSPHTVLLTHKWEALVKSYEHLERTITKRIAEIEHDHAHEIPGDTRRQEVEEIESLLRLLQGSRQNISEQEPKIDELISDLRGQQSQKTVLKKLSNLIFGKKHELEGYINLFDTHVQLMAQLGVRIHGCQIGILNDLVRSALAELGLLASDMRHINGLLKEQGRVLQEVMTGLTAINTVERQRFSLLQPTDITGGLRWKKAILLENLRNLEVASDAVQCNIQTGSLERSAAILTRNKPSQKIQGFVEWKEWDDRGREMGNKTQVGRQLGALSYVLGGAENAPPPEATKVPECAAFFLDYKRDRYGVFFSVHGIHKVDNGSSEMSMPDEPRSLRQLMRASEINEPNELWKLSTARALATALYTMHAWEVCQKAVSSKNVLFFTAAQSPEALPPDKFGYGPYLGGFTQSRMMAMGTEFVRMGVTDLIYLPMEYLDRRRNQPTVSDDTIFHPVYDLFGLGLTLLEVALWKPMEDYLVQWACNDEVLFHRVHWKKVDDLIQGCRQSMAEEYIDFIVWCLSKRSVPAGPDLREHLAEFNQQISHLEVALSRES